MLAWFTDLFGTKKSRALMPMFNLDCSRHRRKQRHCWYSNWTLIAHQDAADSVLVWMFHQTRTAVLENPQDSILPAIKTALATTTQLIGKPHNVCLTGWLQPVLNKERLRIASPVFKLLLCRCGEANDASRLGNNEIKPMKHIGLNSVTKNRAPY